MQIRTQSDDETMQVRELHACTKRLTSLVRLCMCVHMQSLLYTECQYNYIGILLILVSVFLKDSNVGWVITLHRAAVATPV